ncbi:MAG: thioredoxin domain-containing protein [Cyclobacteriaceae bacterium]|nr:thioredoxin domain-containing protein [Cyclobacteriaceae bacterium]
MTTPASPTERKPNRLIHSTSPYLLQHAYNPVDWYEWNPEALTKAKTEDKLIIISIGYSSCHWCHVMERESFENNDLAALMNTYFVCIKVDREERPDIDQIYMDAVQSMGINGGWPLNVFLTPDQKPFYGGTYFPPKAWAQLLRNIHHAWQNRKSEINASADELTAAISANNLSRYLSADQEKQETTVALNTIYRNLEANFDYVWGGLQKAPKFIMPSIWLWLLRHHQLSGDQQALKHFTLTLTKILQGGIYDQLGGGFARYSVDGEWFAPHFEKMLYDNAQLLSLYAEAYQVTKDDSYKVVVYETVAWLEREMAHAEGGYYAALDADSEGIEGKYYCWTTHELEKLTEDERKFFCAYYGVTDSGNWEHGMNILYRTGNDEGFLNEQGIERQPWQEKLNRIKEKLLAVRSQRVRPGLDDKILTGWNAMTVIGLIDAYHAFSDDHFLTSAKKTIAFLKKELMNSTTCYRSFKEKRSATEGFLEDYAYLIKAFIKFYQADFNEEWLRQAEGLLEYTVTNFYDSTDGLFFYTSVKAEKLIARKKELFDNVIPSSNSVMAMNLYHLGIILDKQAWKSMAERMVDSLAELIQKEPNYMSNWAIAFTEIRTGLAEVVIVGNESMTYKNTLQKHYLPFALFMGTIQASELPLLKGKQTPENQTTLYVCRNNVCRQPVQDVPNALQQLLKKG